ncbi:MAG: diguanylate cyclase [Bacilli bacterium]
MREYLDNLTGLYNLFYLKENYQKYIENKEECYLISIDFEKLKYINDNFGHSAGDASIKTFANAAMDIFEDSIIVRRSGDEFVIVTTYNVAEIVERLNSILNKIKETHEQGLIPIFFRFNTGIKLCENYLDETLYKSDITMYNAKKNGKLFEFYNCELLNTVKSEEAFVNEIDDMICNNLTEYYVQQVFDITAQKEIMQQIYTKGIDGKPILCGENFDILVTNFRIKKIDMNNVDRLFSDILPNIKGKQKYSLTIHYETLLNREFGFVDYLKKKIEENNVDFNRIVLNIDITGSIDKPNKLIKILIELKNIGIQLCLDNINFCERDVIVPIVACINIDYAYIHKNTLIKAMNEKRCKLVLESFINLLFELGTIPIFTNIDSEGELEFIKSINDKSLIRGHLFSKEKKLKKS